MAKVRYARFKFNVRKNVLNCIGQRQTRRGMYYPSKLVQIPLENRSAEVMKTAMAKGIAELNEKA